MDDGIAVDEEVPERRSTVPAGFNVSVQGVDNVEAARLLGQTVGEVIGEIGRLMDLSSLDGVTIAVDFDAALRDQDRGVEGLRPDERTNDEDLVGVGKASLVRRGDQIKTHLLFFAGPLSALVLEEASDEAVRLAQGLIAHECGHVEEHGLRDREFPGVLLQKGVEGFVERHVQQFAEACWGEYAVCRRAAPFCLEQENGFRDALSARLQPARASARDAVRSFRTHQDVERVFAEVAVAVVDPLRMTSYLFGHLDGIAKDRLPDVSAEIPTDDRAFVSSIVDLVGQLRDLWDRRGKWTSHDDMLVLGETAFDLIRKFGVDPQPQPDGSAYINVRYTMDTTPLFPSFADLLKGLKPRG